MGWAGCRVGLISALRKIPTKNRDMMCVATLEDKFGGIDVVLFPRTWTKFEAKMIEGAVVVVSGKLDLTRNEYRLLGALLGSPGRVFSRDQLMTAAWDDPGAALDRTVDAHIKTLRAKLREVAPDTEPIETHRGLGYSLKET